MAFRPAVSRGLAFSKVAASGFRPAAIPASCLFVLIRFPEKDVPGNMSRPGFHWLRFVVFAASIALAEKPGLS